MKKPLPPGRRGSVRKDISGIDSGSLDEINVTTPTTVPVDSPPPPIPQTKPPIEVSPVSTPTSTILGETTATSSRVLPPGRRGTFKKENTIDDLTVEPIPTKVREEIPPPIPSNAPKENNVSQLPEKRPNSVSLRKGLLEQNDSIVSNPSAPPPVPISHAGERSPPSLPPPLPPAPPITSESDAFDDVEIEEPSRVKALLAKFQNQSSKAETSTAKPTITAKRRTLLSDLESFSSDFEVKTQLAEERAEKGLTKADEIKAKIAEEDAKRRAEEEAARKRAEEEARRLAEEEAARKRAEEEARRLAEEEAARKRAEEEARRRAEEEAARKRAEEEARRRAEEEARRLAEEEAARKRAEEEEAKRRAEEEAARKRAEEEARRRAEEEAARKRAKEEARRLAEEEAARKRAEEEEVKRRAEEEAARKRAEEEARRRAEEEAARKRAEEEARRLAEEEAARKRAEEEARRRAEEEAARKRAEEEASRLAEEEAARKQAEEEARRRVEEEAARKRVEEEAKRREEEEAVRKREEDARRRAEEEFSQKRAEEEARRIANEEATRREETRQRALEEAAEEERTARKLAAIEEARILKARKTTSSLFGDDEAPAVTSPTKSVQKHSSLFSEDVEPSSNRTAADPLAVTGIKSTSQLFEQEPAERANLRKGAAVTASLFGESVSVNDDINVPSTGGNSGSKGKKTSSLFDGEDSFAAKSEPVRAEVPKTVVIEEEFKVPLRIGSDSASKGKKPSMLFGEEELISSGTKAESATAEVPKAVVVEEEFKVPSRIGGSDSASKGKKPTSLFGEEEPFATTSRSEPIKTEVQKNEPIKVAVVVEEFKVPSRIGSAGGDSAGKGKKPSSLFGEEEIISTAQKAEPVTTEIPKNESIKAAVIEEQFKIPSRIGSAGGDSASKGKKPTSLFGEEEPFVTTSRSEPIKAEVQKNEPINAAVVVEGFKVPSRIGSAGGDSAGKGKKPTSLFGEEEPFATSSTSEPNKAEVQKNEPIKAAVVVEEFKVPSRIGSTRGDKTSASSPTREEAIVNKEQIFVESPKAETSQSAIVQEEFKVPVRIGSDKSQKATVAVAVAVTAGKASLFGDETSTSNSQKKLFKEDIIDSPNDKGSAPSTVTAVNPSIASTEASSPHGEESSAPAGEGELRVPSRIGAGGKSKSNSEKGSNKVKVAEQPIVVAQNETNEDDDVEEGTGDISSLSNILTSDERRRLTSSQKANWRAKQNDLVQRRKEFHGAVTYLLDGIFSWQMYGSAEAIDEYGNAYTEYLMRCQWGTTFDNLQPWIVAHRYREFAKLDTELKKRFPNIEKNIPKLPKKEFFRSKEAAIVAERRIILEEYMSKIVSSMPSINRSDLFDDFLRINERVSSIRNIVNANESKPMMNTLTQADTGVMSSSSPVNDLIVDQPNENTTPYEFEPAKSVGDPAPDWSNMIWSSDEAESYRESNNVPPLDEYSLGVLEDDIRQLVEWTRTLEAKEIISKKGKFRKVLLNASLKWPALRATGTLGGAFDFTLIPRALQAEEDFNRVINEYKNLDAIRAIRK